MRWPIVSTAVVALVISGLSLVSALPARHQSTGGLPEFYRAAETTTARPNSPATDSLGSFGDIHSFDPLEYEFNYQIKITYTGPQLKSTPSLLLHGPGRPPAIGDFYPYNTMFPLVHFGNDDVKVITLGVSGSTLYRLVQALAERPELQTAGDPDSALLSLMIERGTPPGEVVFHHFADDFTARELTALVRAAANFEPLDVRDTLRRFQNFTTGPQ